MICADVKTTPCGQAHKFCWLQLRHSGSPFGVSRSCPIRAEWQLLHTMKPHNALQNAGEGSPSLKSILHWNFRLGNSTLCMTWYVALDGYDGTIFMYDTTQRSDSRAWTIGYWCQRNYLSASKHNQFTLIDLKKAYFVLTMFASSFASRLSHGSSPQALGNASRIACSFQLRDHTT